MHGRKKKRPEGSLIHGQSWIRIRSKKRTKESYPKRLNREEGNMANPEVIIVAIVFGSVFGIVFLGILSNIIKAWIKRDSPARLSENKEFLAALREFKENTDRRISNLEAIIDRKSTRLNSSHVAISHAVD